MKDGPWSHATQENLVSLESLVFPCNLTHGKLASMTTSEVIEARRKALKLSYKRLAELVSEREDSATPISWQTVQQWGKGASAPKRTRLEHVAAVLGISIEELLPSEHSPAQPLRRSDWPFPQLEKARFDRLEPWQQIEIQGAVRNKLKEFEAENAANAKAA